MNITKRESMILRKCINNYMLDNNLDYDKSPLFNDLIHKLKDFEKDKIAHPDRPLPRGLVTKDQVNFLSFESKNVYALIDTSFL